MYIYIYTYEIKQGYTYPFGKEKDFQATETTKGINYQWANAKMDSFRCRKVKMHTS